GATDESFPCADYRSDLRRPRGKHRRTRHAGDPLPRQIGRRTRQGKGNGEDPARKQRHGILTPEAPAPETSSTAAWRDDARRPPPRTGPERSLFGFTTSYGAAN